MDNKQSGTNNMYNSVIAYGDLTPPATVALMPDWTNYYTAFKTKVQDVATIWEFQKHKNKGFRIDKDELKVEVIETSLVLTSKITSLALAIDNTVLFNQMNYPESELIRATDAEIVVIANFIATKVEDNLVALAPYGVVVADLGDYQDLIAAYKIAQPLPRNEIKAKKEATEELALKITEANHFLFKMDFAVKAIRKEQATFVRNYFKRREINDSPTRTLSIRGHVVDQNGNPIRVYMVCETLGINRRVSAKGGFYFKDLDTNIYTIKFIRPNFETVTQNIAVFLGERTDVTITMLPH